MSIINSLQHVQFAILVLLEARASKYLILNWQIVRTLSSTPPLQSVLFALQDFQSTQLEFASQILLTFLTVLCIYQQHKLVQHAIQDQ